MYVGTLSKRPSRNSTVTHGNKIQQKEKCRLKVGRFDPLLRRSPFPQRKTLMHLIVKRITLDDRKHIGSVELAFNEETEKYFLSLAPSAETIAQGAFPLS
ncbi:hypothetical protein [Paenibacillus azoreducens]|uniref:Uncharacterized protein n=1 Tax=Paenibacillus azoreducens TaxID=116718 RepID=A0A919Y9E4_9BACL|nr:hypothetical protein [Paenibacillus azoreducens]GIO47072.1 hypothetical protein J34TS1_18370 [Paenibacillus azoreducens]